MNDYRQQRRLTLRVAIVAMGCLPICVSAMNVEHVETQYENGEYRLELTAILDAPLEQVENVVRDYADYTTLDSRILEARVLTKPEEHVVQLYTKLRMCFGPFCRNVKRVERVQEKPHELLATVIPASSDVERGITRTALYSKGPHTELHYSTRIIPKFWVPAVIGRPIMLRSLREATLEMFKHIEIRARAGMPVPDTHDEQA